MARSAAAARTAPALKPARRGGTRPGGAPPARRGGTKAKAAGGPKAKTKPRAAAKPAVKPRAVLAGGATIRLPLPLPVALPSVLRGRFGAVLDTLLRGQGWIGLIFVLLAGIVFFNVDLLQLNREIASTTERASEIGRTNARLRLELARLGSSERIQRAAASRGLVLPAPGEVRYLQANPGSDARNAAQRIREPGDSPAPPATSPQAPEGGGQLPAGQAPAGPTQPTAQQPAAVTPAPTPVSGQGGGATTGTP